MPLGAMPQNLIIWFRPEIARTVNWAGDPAKPVEILPGLERLTPRRSFEIWTEDVRGRSLSWEPHEITAADGLRDIIVEIILRSSQELERRNTELSRANERLDALASANATLYDAARREVAERQRAQAQLEAANRELEAFSYSVSHDLRSPLRAIEGFSNILAEEYGEKLDSEGKRIVSVIIGGSTKMTRMIADILAFSRAGRGEMTSETMDMQALVQAEIAALQSEIGGRAVRFDVGSLPKARGDAVMLRQIWANLLGNAVKYTAPREEATIQIGAEPGLGESVYFVRDNGAGFDMAHVEKLFGAFQRLHGAEFPGTGIGLSIVKRIVMRHGGRVWADGKVGDGATFYFTIPTGDNQAAIARPLSDNP